ncbi:starch synthase [Lutibacter sp. Hel_I_33_5]|uniref:glycogen synthase n=1 Tax=Lutibacter sp. Hel_I_33_5 TaxID=1566289 RepID=UPI0011A71E76|nr:glycogen/starch synthase [Lutibacter sp. Hel_I_33_5]TVZ57197.1 starch synthase [Lutibacter sp. Hel_I_33_5]
MNILHITAECYPIAKVGGLADVAGALPKYQNELKTNSNVVMPFYNNTFTQNNNFEKVYNNTLKLGDQNHNYTILKIEDDALGFDLFCVDVPSLLYKDYVYSVDDTDRFLAFQIATLDWVLTLEKKPDIIHTHDHHTGLIPFMVSQCFKYESLKFTPTVLTIHNAQYQGWFAHNKVNLIPQFNFDNVGLLDWGGNINPLAAAIKCSWRVTTVSPSYMEELKQKANGLEDLLNHESAKCVGILNGIDWKVWNPETDSHIIKNYKKSTIVSGKKANKDWLCKKYNLDNKKPLFVFIGRLVHEKGADLFSEIFKKALSENDISILLLGSGDKTNEESLKPLLTLPNFNAHIGYDEKLSHIIYAGGDFLLMPSRVEPCGLNQMYSLRYGTVPIVNAIGGLKDTIIDIKNDGFGIRHNGVNIEETTKAIARATAFYQNKKEFSNNSKKIMEIDHSWNNSAQEYVKLYQSLKN